MAEMIETKERSLESAASPDLDQIAEYVERHAQVLHESGWSEDASNLRRWAQELRRKLYDKHPADYPTEY